MSSVSMSGRGWLWLIALWTLCTVLGLAFLAAAGMKLTGQPMMVAEFKRLGFGQWFRYGTGVIEVLGGIALFVPAVWPFGALLLLCVDAGAFVAQVTVLHGDFIHTIVLGALLFAVAVMQRDRAMGPSQR